MYRDLELMLADDSQVFGGEKTFQQQDRLGPSQFAQAHRAVEFDQAQAIGRGKTAHTARQTMAIGIRLDDRPHLGTRRTCFGDGEIVLHGGDINGGYKRSRHRNPGVRWSADLLDWGNLWKRHFTGRDGSNRASNGRPCHIFMV